MTLVTVVAQPFRKLQRAKLGIGKTS